MADVLRNGIQWLADQRASHMASAISYYRRGSGTPQAAPTTATVAAIKAEDLLDGDFVATASLKDWIMAASDFVTAGVFQEPEPGDLIVDTNTGATWEVCELGLERCWRYSDAYSFSVRVHTVLRSVGGSGGH